MKKVLLPLLIATLGWMLGTFLAPIAINIIVWLLQPDYITPYRCTYGGSQDSPTERERRKGQV